jgi:molybdopterin-containing oxidoreductase family iron-sulfur binding subunit
MPEFTSQQVSRRDAIKGLFAACASACATGCGITKDDLNSFVQKHFREMEKPELDAVLAKWERNYKKNYHRDIKIGTEPAQEGVLFGYALDISRCIGCRKCVYACVDENNLSRDPQVHWISVLEMDKKHGIDLEHANQYYDHDHVPQDDKFYMPVACQQCENPPCVKSCPTKATWKEPDGIVVIDYDWCIGCRCCVTACPYGARHFNWATPTIPEDEVNTDTHYLGNRPRPRGVVEKCTFCIQRTRKGKYPACVEICPVGARKFGNLLDPESEVRYVLDNHRVYILKEELGTEPKFFYYFGV